MIGIANFCIGFLILEVVFMVVAVVGSIIEEGKK